MSPADRSSAFGRWALRHGRVLWLSALLLAVPATWRTVGLYAHLRTELEELLPRDAPSVKAITELRARLAGIQHLGVVVDTGTADNLPAAERMIDDLAARVRAYPPDLVRDVRTGSSAERSFLEAHAPLYVDLDDLRTVRARLEARRDWEVSRETGELLDPDETPPPVDLGDIRARYEERARLAGHGFDHDRFSSRQLHLTLMLVETASFDTGRARGAELLSRVKSDLVALGGPDAYAPGMRVGYAGDIAISVEETGALREDLSVSSVVVVLAVGGAIVLYYRWWCSGLLLIAPLALATVYAFALASLPPFDISELNSNTAFLGAIIVGNGINFGIVLLARYVEERREGATVEASVERAIRGARRGTLAAALAAAVSYGSLVVTDFRGFRQFGVIGCIGMLLSWGLAFLLLPSLCAWLDRGTVLRAASGFTLARLARFTSRFAVPLATILTVLTILAALRMSRFGPSDIESDFSRLRRADTWTRGEGYWGRRMDALLQTYLTPIVVLTDDGDSARAIVAALRQAAREPPLESMVSSVRTLDDVLPADQGAKIEQIRAIRQVLTPKIRSLLRADEQREVDRLLGSEALEPVGVDDLPRTFTLGLRERDGSTGETVLVYPRPSHALWDGATIARFVGTLRTVAASASPPSRPARVAGSLPLSADILAAVKRDGPIATALAFAGVSLVVIATLGRRPGSLLLVLGALCVGVLWLAGLSMALGVKLNFANFIAYPITFGIGVDYSVNVVTRYVDDGKDDWGRAVATTGGAVALCSATTIIGYSSLLMAQNRALMLFGLLAVLGEVCCLAAAIVGVPACVEAWRRRRSG
jgi:predicted RND superfamily exporter protein